jgi:hypothetical protein
MRELAIIDQHVAHERVLFEQVMERLTRRRLESQRLLTPILLELSPGSAPCARRARLHAGTVRNGNRGLWRREWCGCRQFRRSWTAPRLRSRDSGACRGSRRARPGDTRGGCPPPDRCDDGLSRRGQGQLSADAREDAAISSKNCASDGLFQRLPARPSGAVLRLSRREISKNFQRI